MLDAMDFFRDSYFVDNKTFGEKVKTLRWLCSQTQSEFGKAMGLHKNSICAIETNTEKAKELSLDQLLKFYYRITSIIETVNTGIGNPFLIQYCKWFLPEIRDAIQAKLSKPKEKSRKKLEFT